MTQYAYFDSTQSPPSPVLGWYDTAALSYPSLPSQSDLLELTSVQWSARLTGSWAVASGALVTYVPPTPTPTLAQQAQALLATGLEITSTGDGALDGTYPCGAAIQLQVNSEVTSILLNDTFTDGSTSLAWLDASGAPHEFSIAQFKTLATALAAFATGCIRCVTGQSTALPSSSATIA